MESSPHWPKLTVLSCASRCSTNQITVSTFATLTTALDRARESTHSWCKVTRESEKKKGKRDVWWRKRGTNVDKELGCLLLLRFFTTFFYFCRLLWLLLVLPSFFSSDFLSFLSSCFCFLFFVFLFSTNRATMTTTAYHPNAFARSCASFPFAFMCPVCSIHGHFLRFASTFPLLLRLIFPLLPTSPGPRLPGRHHHHLLPWLCNPSIFPSFPLLLLVLLLSPIILTS